MPWYEDAGCRNPCGMEPMGCASCQERGGVSLGDEGDFDEGDFDDGEMDGFDDGDEESGQDEGLEAFETPLGDALGGE